MDFELTDDQKVFRNQVAKFAKEEIAPVAREVDERDLFPDDVIEKAARLGLMGVIAPLEYGGMGRDMVSYALAIEEVARASPAIALTVSVNNSLLCKPIQLFGSEDQKRELLPNLAKGVILGSFALTEPGAGSDAASLSTRAVKDGDGFLISGEKAFITNAGKSGIYLIFAKTSPESGAKGITAFLVDGGSPGLTVGEPMQKMGMRGSRQAPLKLEGVRVPSQRILGKEGEGFKIALSALNFGRIGIAAQAVGIAQAALEDAVDFSSHREQFGKAIADLPEVSGMLADMATEVMAARLLLLKAAWSVDAGISKPTDSSMAKLYASQMANEVVSKSLHIHGGRGYLKGYRVERMYRDAKITEIYEGTSEVQRKVIARELLRG